MMENAPPDEDVAMEIYFVLPDDAALLSAAPADAPDDDPVLLPQPVSMDAVMASPAAIAAILLNLFFILCLLDGYCLCKWCFP